jgi:uncharacterized protein (DUF1778 family)
MPEREEPAPRTSSSPLRGQQLGVRRGVGAVDSGPHRPYEGQQRGVLIAQEAPREPVSSSPLRGAATRPAPPRDTTCRVLIAPMRGQQQLVDLGAAGVVGRIVIAPMRDGNSGDEATGSSSWPRAGGRSPLFRGAGNPPTVDSHYAKSHRRLPQNSIPFLLVSFTFSTNWPIRNTASRHALTSILRTPGFSPAARYRNCNTNSFPDPAGSGKEHYRFAATCPAPAGTRDGSEGKTPARHAGAKEDAAMRSEPQTPAAQHRRTRHQGTSRTCRIAISVNEAEQEELEQAARAEALTVSAFVAEKALAAARGTVPQSAVPLREALTDLTRATAQIQKAGTNLNQAVAALNATGEAPGNLVHYARYTITVVDKIDQIVLRIRQHLP